MADCNQCGSGPVPTKHWKFPSDEKDGPLAVGFYGWDYCEVCWELVKEWNLEECGEPAPEFNDG